MTAPPLASAPPATLSVSEDERKSSLSTDSAEVSIDHIVMDGSCGCLRAINHANLGKQRFGVGLGARRHQ